MARRLTTTRASRCEIRRLQVRPLHRSFSFAFFAYDVVAIFFCSVYLVYCLSLLNASGEHPGKHMECIKAYGPQSSRRELAMGFSKFLPVFIHSKNPRCCVVPSDVKDCFVEISLSLMNSLDLTPHGSGPIRDQSTSKLPSSCSPAT